MAKITVIKKATVNAKAINPHAKPAKDPLTSSKGSTYGELPACTACPLNTCVSAQLFPDIHAQDDAEKKTLRDCRCTNPTCYEAKMAIHLTRQQTELSKKHPDLVPVSRQYDLPPEQSKRLPGVLTAKSYEEVKPNARNAKPALVVDGNDRGSVIYVAPPKDRTPAKPVRIERPLEDRRKELEQKIETASRKAMLIAMSKPGSTWQKEATKLNPRLLLDLAAFAVSEGLDTNERVKFFIDAFKDQYGYEAIRKTMEKFERPKLAAALLGGLYGRMALSSNWSDGHKLLTEAAKAFGVDVKKIETDTRKEFSPELARLQSGKKAPAGTRVSERMKKTKAAATAKAKPQTSAKRKTA